MFQTQIQKEREAKIRATIAELKEELKKLEEKIRKTAPKTWLLRNLCSAKDSLEAQINSQVNLLNTMKRW